jgi:hypothetical protein
MLISASRRTDIPAFYADWLLNRIREKYVLVRNPMNPHRISKVNLSPEVVDGIVFWTKNPSPMLNKLKELYKYTFYFLFTITGYEKDIEPNVPDKSTVIIPTFLQLSDLIGRERVIWRYDPILFNDKYTLQYHCHAFEQIAKRLQGHPQKCTISFVDLYRCAIRNVKGLHVKEATIKQMQETAEKLSHIAQRYNLRIDTCAEIIDLQPFGIEHAHCIDVSLFEKLNGQHLSIEKDKNQRLECACAASVDIGMYNTCKHYCRYCYANHSDIMVNNNHEKHDPNSPLLFGKIEENDKITEREMRSNRENRLF